MEIEQEIADMITGLAMGLNQKELIETINKMNNRSKSMLKSYLNILTKHAPYKIIIEHNAKGG